MVELAEEREKGPEGRGRRAEGRGRRGEERERERVIQERGCNRDILRCEPRFDEVRSWKTFGRTERLDLRCV